MGTFSRRVALIAVFGITQGNPNGDPDADNAPRRDSADRVITSGESLKRKIRDAVAALHPDAPGMAILIGRGAVLERAYAAAVKATGGELADGEEAAKTKGKGKQARADAASASTAIHRIVADHWDVRAFGAVLSTGTFANAADGAIRGPVQVAPGVSIAPDRPIETTLTVTRVAVASEAEAEAQQGANRTMGRRHVVEHAIIVQRIDVNPFDAARTGFSDEDYQALIEGITHGFELSNASGRRVTLEALYEVEATSKLGGGAMLHVDRMVEAIPRVDVPMSPAEYDLRLAVPDGAPGIASVRVLIEPYRPPRSQAPTLSVVA